MARYFVAASGSNTSPYDTWAKAATSWQTAITAATGTDEIIIQYDGVPTVDRESSGTTTYTFATGSKVAVISSTNSGTNTVTPTPMDTSGWIGNSTASRAVTITGTNCQVFLYGLTFRRVSSSNINLSLGVGDGMQLTTEDCFDFNTGTSVNNLLVLGPTTNSFNSFQSHKNFKHSFGNASQSISIRSNVDFIGSTIRSGSTAASSFFSALSPDASGCAVNVYDSDLTGGYSAFLAGDATAHSLDVFIYNSKLPSGASLLAPQTVTNRGGASVTMVNCSDGDEHYQFGYANALGELSISTAIYADASYDGTNNYSWKIDTTANTTFYNPFVTPWIEVYHNGTSAITPALEILRNGSATAYQNDEVWVEFGYQGTTNGTKGVLVDDRMTLAGTPANQDAGAGLSAWTGESGTAWSGKLVSPSITPVEIGSLRARVNVGEPSITVYVNPKIDL